ncbi:hypothetical protein pb186bvf_012777 [Paramecium bursaria]
MSDHDLHENVNIQQKNEMIKRSIVSQFELSLANIYKVCTPFCIKDYKKHDLSEREKVCLSKCFSLKNESLRVSLEYLEKAITPK